MTRERAKTAPITGGAVAGRLLLVAAACLLLRYVPELPLRLPEALPEAVLALTLPGYVPKDAAPALALSLELPGGLPGKLSSSAPPSNTPDPSPGPDAPATPDVPTEPDVLPEPEPSPPPEPSPEPDPPSNPDVPKAVDTTIISGGGKELSKDIYIKNKTDYTIDVEALLDETLEFSASDGAQVLIIHTHGSEAYMPDGEDVYVPSDPYRTENDDYNVVRVGDELERILTERGITVIHDRSLYDFPTYSGSYNRALEAIHAALKEHPGIKVVIDLHRDALMGNDGTVYKTVADIGDTPSAQVMLIAGSNFSGLKHPNWQKNLCFALKLQAAMVSRYPTLARPLKLSEYRYNQHVTTGSLIVEVGTCGNTLQEALTAVGYFGDCLASVLGA